MLRDRTVGQKVTLSRYKPGQTLSAPDSQNIRTIGTWRWQGCQPYGPAAFTAQEIQSLNRPQSH